MDKFNRYVEARQVIDQFYRNAAIGFRFEDLGINSEQMTPELRQAIEEAIQRLQAEHPDITIQVDWGH